METPHTPAATPAIPLAEPAPIAARKIRASRMGKWRAAVLIGVHVLIGLHITHWLTSGETLTPVEPSEAMAFGQRSVINAGLIFFASTILLTAFFGRFFCGWGCHLVALQDWCRHLLLKIGIQPRPLRSRVLMWVPSVAFVYMFLWPAIYRLWIGDSFAIQAVELTTSEFWATFPGWVIGGLTFLVCGFACVYFLGAKGFCTYACPYGAVFAAVDRIAPMRIRVSDACNQCGHCTAVCSSNVRVHEEVRDWGMVVSPGCMKCQDCVSVCPTGALRYGPGQIPLFARRRTPAIAQRTPAQRPRAPLNWREEALLLAAFATCFFVVRGLYGLVPFLMALGVAGVMAFLLLTSIRMWRLPTVERSGLRLKRDGRVLPQGRVFIVVIALLGVFFAHSAVLRYWAWQGEGVYDDSAALRSAVLAQPGQVPLLAGPAAAELRAAGVQLAQVEAFGLFRTLGNAARRAWVLALAGDDPAAVAQAREAIARGEIPGEMHQLLAHLALLRLEPSAALREWEAAIAAEPGRPEAYLALGLRLAGDGNLLAAQEVFDRGVEQVGHSAALYYNAGLARALSGQSEVALPFFEQALRLEPSHLEARENYAGLLAILGRYEESLVHYARAVEQSPNDPQTRVLQARVLLALGREAQAQASLNAAVKIDPTFVEARTLLEQIRSE